MPPRSSDEIEPCLTDPCLLVQTKHMNLSPGWPVAAVLVAAMASGAYVLAHAPQDVAIVLVAGIFFTAMFLASSR